MRRRSAEIILISEVLKLIGALPRGSAEGAMAASVLAVARPLLGRSQGATGRKLLEPRGSPGQPFPPERWEGPRSRGHPFSES